jgi:hypothetical protein
MFKKLSANDKKEAAMIYSSDITIADSLLEHGKFALYYGRAQFAQFDTYGEAKEAAVKRAKRYKGVAVYLWGHCELEPEIPMLIHNPGYKRLY